MKLFYSILAIILISSNYTNAQDFYDIETIQTIELNFAESNWDQLMDNAYSAESGYIMAQSITINGTSFDSVGVKYKGNSSYSANQVKNPWHIELDTYKEQEYDGYTDIKLANGYKDPSMVREVLAYQIVGQYMVAPKANYANLYVNGQLIGLYTNTESISKRFMGDRFGSKENTRFKCSPPDGAGPQSSDYPNLVYLGQDSTDYYDSYEIKSDEGWQDLIDLTDSLANHTDEIENILDINRVLWMLAFHNVIVNLDSYIGRFAQNYYLYRSDQNQFMPVVWDLNESFGVFSQTGTINLNNTTAKQQMTHLLHENDTQFPLVQKLLSNPTYKRMYLAHMKTIVEENFEDGSYFTTASNLQTIIDDAVQADGNKFFTYNNFISNLTSDITSGGGPGGGTYPGLSNLMDGRSDYLLGLSDFNQTEPEITAITLSTNSPELLDNITITSSVNNANTVYLGFRNKSLTAPFTKVEMFDDGAHGDGEANDGIYGTDIIISSPFMEYYVYAENNDLGKFSPRRAEYEFYEINAFDNSASGVVINEFMASNDVTEADQDGEFDDWIEFYNNGMDELDLSGYYLTDDADDLTKWSFPVNTVIAPGAYLVVWADNDQDQDGLHTNFKLSSSGETILLVSPQDNSILDAIAYPSQLTDISYGRFPNGTGPFVEMNPTFNAENTNAIDNTEDFIETKEFKIYPNPADDFFIIEFNDSAHSNFIRIYDMTGKSVYSGNVINNTSINTSAWTSGMYFIKSESTVSKIMVR
jgi:hypothetical protein